MTSTTTAAVLVRCAECGARVFDAAVCLDCQVAKLHARWNAAIRLATECTREEVEGFGRMLVRSIEAGAARTAAKAAGTMPNAAAWIDGSFEAAELEEVRSIYRARFGESGKEVKSPLFVEDGMYTIAYPDGEDTFTFKIGSPKTGMHAGKRIAYYLKGEAGSLDFVPFALVNEHSLNVFFKFERLSGASGWLVNKAREIEKLIREGKGALDAAGFAYAQRSNRCRYCNKVLTDVESKAAGCGVDCAEIHGIPHAALERRKARQAPVEDWVKDLAESLKNVPTEEPSGSSVECLCVTYAVSSPTGDGYGGNYTDASICPLHGDGAADRPLCPTCDGEGGSRGGYRDAFETPAGFKTCPDCLGSGYARRATVA